MNQQNQKIQLLIAVFVSAIAPTLMPTLNPALGQIEGQAARPFKQVNALGIDGPFEVEPGELVRLTASIGESESPFWIVLKPDDLQYEQIENGRGLIFAASCKSRASIVVMLLAQSVKDGRIVTRQLRRKIEIVDSGDAPPDQISPIGDLPIDKDPEKEPAKPNPKYPIFKACYDAVLQMKDVTAISKVEGVAANFQNVGQRCSTSEFADIQTVWTSLVGLNGITIGRSQPQWDPVGVALQKSFKQLAPKTVAEHGPLLMIAAQAMRKAVQDRAAARPATYPLLRNDGVK